MSGYLILLFKIRYVDAEAEGKCDIRICHITIYKYDTYMWRYKENVKLGYLIMLFTNLISTRGRIGKM